jgi:F0F1-type ATP synthase assembly protein I
MSAGMKTSEFLALFAGIIGAIVPVLMDRLPAESMWGIALGCLLAASTYIVSRTTVKVTDIKAKALIASKQGTSANPQ